MHAFPILAADIGGTNARFTVVEADGRTAPLGTFGTRDFESAEAAACHALESWPGERPQAAVMALACPISGDTFPLTNADWEIVPAEFLEMTGFLQLSVMNDFMAQGLASITLPMKDLHQIGGAARDEDAPRVIVGPGTGLGVALAVKADEKWVVIPGEGGHVDLGPRSEREFAIWPFLRKQAGRMEAELAISGQGLENLCRAVRRADGLEPGSMRAAEISKLALADEDVHAREAVETMTRLLARLAGDLAITTMARGGIYLAGGIAQHVLPILDAPEFRATFDDKTPFSAIMREMPIYVMAAKDAAITGIAGYVCNPERFAPGNGIRHFRHKAH